MSNGPDSHRDERALAMACTLSRSKACQALAVFLPIAIGSRAQHLLILTTCFLLKFLNLFIKIFKKYYE
jgi:hypothetical protein